MKSTIVVLSFCFGMVMALAQEPSLPEATSTPAPSPSARPELNIPDIPMTVEPSPIVPNTTTAQTDPEKRDLTRAYYKIFYGRMEALAETPDVKAYLEQRKKDIINSLAQ